MFHARIALIAFCAFVGTSLFTSNSIAGDYQPITTAQFSAGPPAGVSFSGTIMWGTSDPDINWVEGEILDSAGNQVTDLGSLDFTYSGSTRTTTITNRFVNLSPGTYRIKLHWFHNEGSVEKAASTSALVTVQDPGY